MGLIVRFPKFDFSDFVPHWSHNRAFSMDRNANAIIPSPIEPWLIKLLQEAKPHLPADATWLKEEADKFIAQESQHFRQHRLFIRKLAEAGYPRVSEFEAELAAELDEFTRTKSMKWRIAYADGFESLGAVASLQWFERSEEMIHGLDNSSIRMWKWHVAEEFEHREVCFGFFKAMYGRGLFNKIYNGYFYRIYGLLMAMKHLGGFSTKVIAYMTEIDTSTMTADERAQFDREVKAYKKFTLRGFLAPLLLNLLPWYNPGRKRTPKGVNEYLLKFEKDGEWSATAAAKAA